MVQQYYSHINVASKVAGCLPSGCLPAANGTRLSQPLPTPNQSCLGERVFSLQTIRLLQRGGWWRVSHARSLRCVRVGQKRSYARYRSFPATRSRCSHAGVPDQVGSGGLICIDLYEYKGGSWAREAVSAEDGSISTL